MQSWLVSLAYATAEQVGGLDGVRLLVGALAAILAGLAWTLLRPADGRGDPASPGRRCS